MVYDEEDEVDEEEVKTKLRRPSPNAKRQENALIWTSPKVHFKWFVPLPHLLNESLKIRHQKKEKQFRP